MTITREIDGKTVEIELKPEEMMAAHFKFQKQCDTKTNKWYVLDTDSGKSIYESNFENVSLACHNLNKKYYRVS